MECISFRRNQLFRSISQALEINNDQLAFTLESQFVHRYGLSSLNSFVEDERNYASHISLEESEVEQGSNNPSVELNTNHLASIQTCLTDAGNFFVEDERNYASDISLEESEVEQGSNNPSVELNTNHLASIQTCFMDEADSPVALEKDMNSMESVPSERSANDSIYSGANPPPAPSLSHLRRWIPEIVQEIPKAS